MQDKITQISKIKRDVLTVHYKGEKININISQELSISENVINSQLKDSPSSYAFLCLLRDKQVKLRDTLERSKDVAYSEAYIYYKGSGSGITNETAQHKANSNPKYKSLYKKYLRAVSKASNFISICRAYEGREKILQTVSANLRREH